MLHTKFHGNWFKGSGEEELCRFFFNIYGHNGHLGHVTSIMSIQGSHKLWKSWKTWKITNKNSMHGKIMEFDKS